MYVRTYCWSDWIKVLIGIGGLQGIVMQVRRGNVSKGGTTFGILLLIVGNLHIGLGNIPVIR